MIRNAFKHLLGIGFVAAFVLFAQQGATPLNSDDEIFLYRAVEQVSPGYFPLDQGRIGTCVAVAHKGAVDGSQAVEKVTGKASVWKPVSAESIYGGARNESRGRASGSYSDGSSGYAATNWLTHAGGVTFQQPYPQFGFDLSRYDISRAKDWGAWGNGGRSDGIGGPFDREAQKHKVKSTAKVTTLEELDAALKNGFFVTICSGQGFNSPRDKDGFCRPAGS